MKKRTGLWKFWKKTQGLEVKRTIQPINIPGQAMIPVPITVKVGGATIFVIDVFDFKKF